MKRLLVSFACLIAAVAYADDVPQFRGAGGLGTSSEKNLPITWSKTENVRWKAALPGRGLSNPVIAGGRAFVTASSGSQQDRLHVVCFDVADGKPRPHGPESADVIRRHRRIAAGHHDDDGKGSERRGQKPPATRR